MFTGIVESIGQIIHRESSQNNISLWMQSQFIHELKIDQSVAHNGICLTIDKIEEERYRVTAIDETIQKTTIADWQVNQYVNLERCMKLSDRIDGHIVQGHVDAVGNCISVENKNGSWEFTFQYPKEFAHLVIEKGSIALDGISLTCHCLMEDTFKVSIIPYTYEYTIAQYWQVNKQINIEFDIIGKYLNRRMTIS